MKKILFISLIMTISFFSFSQKCKFDFNETDAFTGKSSKGFNLTISGAWKTKLSLMDDTYYIGILIVLPGVTEYQANKGDTCFLALENGDKLILFADYDVLPSSDVANSGTAYADVRTYYSLVYKMTKEQMVNLAASPLKAMRIYLNETPVYLDVIPKKNTEKIIKAAACLIQ